MRHLLDFQGWSRTEVESLLDTARVMREVLEIGRASCRERVSPPV